MLHGASDVFIVFLFIFATVLFVVAARTVMTQRSCLDHFASCPFESRTSPSAPAVDPSASPAVNPTVSPVVNPTVSPAVDPTVSPAVDPTVSPAASPAVDPTVSPAASPAFDPTVSPAVDPTVSPAVDPTVSPAASPQLSVTGFQSDGYQGKSFQVTPKPDGSANCFTSDNLVAAGVGYGDGWHNGPNSFRVPNGLKLTIYDGGQCNTDGQFSSFTTDVPNLEFQKPKNDWHWEHSVASITVEAVAQH